MNCQCYFVLLGNLIALKGDTVSQVNMHRVFSYRVVEFRRFGLCVMFVHQKSEVESASHNIGKGESVFSLPGAVSHFFGEQQ